MAKFSGTQTDSRLVASQPDATTHGGMPGFIRDTRSELFLFAQSNLVGEGTFYEGAKDRDSRFVTLIRDVAAHSDEDGASGTEWLLNLVTWLRGTANMRSAAVVIACETVKANLDAGRDTNSYAQEQRPRPDGKGFYTAVVINGISASRRIVSAACQRPDEPAEVVGYWLATYGRNIPKVVKRGVADAVRRLYTENASLRYDGGTRGIRMGDVIELTHPTPDPTKQPSQGLLFQHLLNTRHGHMEDTKAVLSALPITTARRALENVSVSARRQLLADAPDMVRAARFSWEALSGWLADGKGMDAATWEFAIEDMGYMALLRNLRNLDDAGISAATVEAVKARLCSAEEVVRSHQLPMRFLSAYKAVAGTRWLDVLEQAFNHSLKNVPALPGHTLVLIDRSGSMFWSQLSAKSKLNWAEAAALFGTAVAMRAEKATLVQFGSTAAEVAFTSLAKGGSALRSMERFGDLGGTDTVGALRKFFDPDKHTQVVIVTDEQGTQAHYTSYYGRSTIDDVVPTKVPIITFNLVGYQVGQTKGLNRHTLGGLSDASFTTLALLLAGQSTWPWEVSSTAASALVR